MPVAVKDVKGVTAELEAKLRGQGIKDSDGILALVATPKSRKELAEKLGIDPKAVLELANRADLIRIKGVAGVYADLLEEAGVDTVKELAKRVPANLHAKLVEVNENKKLTTRTTTLEAVTAWIAEAKTLPTILEY